VIREFFEKRRIRKAFSAHLSPEVMDKLLSQSISTEPALREAQLGFVCVSVQGETSQLISERMGFVCDLALKHEGTVIELISGLVIIAYGLFVDESDQILNRTRLCESLKAELVGDVKIVHGRALGHIGNIGSKTRMSFSFIVPGFLDALGILARLPYGEVYELKNN
jgi:hypothetical protein